MFMKGLRRLRRRPSASMVVASLALFVALSGGAYAAVTIPSNSVGFSQLKPGAVGFRDVASGAVGTRDVANNAITYAKIAPGEIGHARVAQNQVQWRVTGACTGPYAIQSIANTGKVTCTASLPTDYSTAGLSEPLTSPTNATALATDAVPAGDPAYVTSTPYIQVNGSSGDQQATVSCALSVGSVTQTRDLTLNLDSTNEQAAGSIPLQVTAPASGSPQAVTVACSRGYNTGTAPTVEASAGADVMTLGAATPETTPGTSTSGATVTVPTTQTTPATTTTTTSATSAAQR